ncbi:unnamed protein product, partial [Penicillium discolor]
YLSDPDTSDGSRKPGSEDSATFAARPTPNSCIPPHHTGMPASRATSCAARATVSPPIRDTLMLRTRPAPSRIMVRRSPRSTTDSSRHTSVSSRDCRSAWATRSRGAKGCSIMVSASRSRRANTAVARSSPA